MEKINMPVSVDEQWEQKERDMLEEMKKQPILARLLQSQPVSDEVLLDHFPMLDRLIESEEKCRQCTSLLSCRQPLSGKEYCVEIQDGHLVDFYKDCRFARQETKKKGHRRFFRESDMGEEDYLIDFKEIDLSVQSKEYIQVFMEADRSIDGDKGLYLYGQTGVGKSYLMKALCNEYAKNGKRVCFCWVPMMVEKYQTAMQDYELRQSMMYHFVNSEILVLDDIGAEAVTAWKRDSILFPIVDQRLMHGRKTYFTSNYSLPELQKRYSDLNRNEGKVPAERLIDRIRPLVKPVCLKGQSKR
ncbi:MAG: ATP-binding protein [Erysipelotrichaceae bacterium]|nr:ATP-binding protein [Erysipelotrichaceae bacterium]